MKNLYILACCKVLPMVMLQHGWGISDELYLKCGTYRRLLKFLLLWLSLNVCVQPSQFHEAKWSWCSFNCSLIILKLWGGEQWQIDSFKFNLSRQTEPVLLQEYYQVLTVYLHMNWEIVLAFRLYPWAYLPGCKWLVPAELSGVSVAVPCPFGGLSCSQQVLWGFHGRNGSPHETTGRERWKC